MRFITANTSMYVNPGSEAAVNFNQTVSVDISQANPALGALAS